MDYTAEQLLAWLEANTDASQGIYMVLVVNDGDFRESIGKMMDAEKDEEGR